MNRPIKPLKPTEKTLTDNEGNMDLTYESLEDINKLVEEHGLQPKKVFPTVGRDGEVLFMFTSECDSNLYETRMEKYKHDLKEYRKYELQEAIKKSKQAIENAQEVIENCSNELKEME